MITPADCAAGRLVPFPLDQEEHWLVHPVLLNSVELASAAGTDAAALRCERGVLEALEAGDSAFTPHELDRIRHELAAYGRAVDTPDRDRPVAAAVLGRLDDRLARQPACASPSPERSTAGPSARVELESTGSY